MSLFTFPASGTEVLQPGIDSKALAGESKHDDADDCEDEDEVEPSWVGSKGTRNFREDQASQKLKTVSNIFRLNFQSYCPKHKKLIELLQIDPICSHLDQSFFPSIWRSTALLGL